MKKLPVALLVLALVFLAGNAPAQNPALDAQVRPEKAHLYACLSGRELRFGLCARDNEGVKSYELCTYQLIGSKIFTERCRMAAEESPGVFSAHVYPQLCAEFTVRYEVCFEDEEKPCVWSQDSHRYVLLPDLDGDGVVGQGDYMLMRAGWGTRYGIYDFSCLSIWWDQEVPPNASAPEHVCW